MIKELTKEQEALIPVFIEKWVSQASIKVDKDKAIDATNRIYLRMGLKAPQIVFCESPLDACKKAVEAKKTLKENKCKDERDLYKETNSEWYLSFWWLSWCGWYSFGKEIGVKYEDETIYNDFIDFVSEVSFIIPYENICFISEKPEINWLNRMLHNDKGASVLYPDGYSLWSLNGIKVPREIVETPANELSTQLVLTEKNADIRREIIRKIGIERIEKELGSTVIDEKTVVIGEKNHFYQLIMLNLGDDRKRPFLKMTNPSLNIVHIEGVKPDIMTVESALCYRNRLDKWKAPVWLS